MDEPLPDLHQGDLDADQLATLFQDLAAFAVIHGISAKGGTQAYTAGEGLTLAAAQHALQDRTVHGLQIRYSYQGAHWIDTLLVRPTGVRVVRIQTP